MRSISVKEAKVGMVLARPITDQQGRTIVNSGTQLTQLYISRLEKWGVQSLVVEDSGPAVPAATETLIAAVAPAAQAAAAGTAEPAAPEALPPGVAKGPDLGARIMRTFARVGDDPLMAALGQSVLRRLVGGRKAGG